MENAVCRVDSTTGFRPTIKLVVLSTPATSENEKYQEFLSELQSYCCGYWKWLRKRRIREVFVVGSLTNPEKGKIEKIRIKRKTAEFIELTDSSRFDPKTGRYLYTEQKYIFPVENRLVWDAWEPQSLWQRVDRALPALPLKAVRAYADLLHPNWHFGGLFDFRFGGDVQSLSERVAASMASSREFAKKAILGHLPGTVHEFRALVEMMERDAK